MIVGGAELFTGNNLIVMAWADRKVETFGLLRKRIIVYVSNFVGALGCVVLVSYAGVMALSNGGVADTAVAIAKAGIALLFLDALLRGLLCNVLVCLAVWTSFASHYVSSKIIAIVFPVAAFIKIYFKHSAANMQLIPLALLLTGGTGITVSELFDNFIPMTPGNIVRSGGFIALVY